jgi:hypothetical protein
MSMAMHMALEKVKKGTPVRQAAAATGLWPSSVYIAAKREGVQIPDRKPSKKAVAK